MSLRERWAGGAVLRGPFCGLPSPDVVEVICAAEPDFVCIDGEHSPIRGSLLVNMLRAARCHQIPVIVRVAEGLPHLIAEVLDAGAAGVLVPRISSAASARSVVDAARFPPHGARGVGPGRAAGYGYDIARVIENTDALVGIQIESMEAVAAAEEIISVPGLDFALIGPGDLSVSLAASGQDKQLNCLVDEIFEVARGRNLPCGIFVPDRNAATTESSRARIIIQGSDAMLLAGAARTAFQ